HSHVKAAIAAGSIPAPLAAEARRASARLVSTISCTPPPPPPPAAAPACAGIDEHAPFEAEKDGRGKREKAKSDHAHEKDGEQDLPVALKRLAENLAANDEFKHRFLREARLAARLSHPNIVAVYDVGEEGGRPCIVMEYVEGETLSDLLRRRGRLEPAEAVALALQACSGLETAHQAGLVHRDIKPQNLLLTPEATLKFADFGIAR